MAQKNEYYDLLYAYALGCLEEKDLNQLKEIQDADEEYPWLELGEFQNLVALLPSILNIETPSPQLKDKVARKLYRIRNERRRTHVTSEKLKKTTEETPSQDEVVPEPDPDDKNISVEEVPELNEPAELDSENFKFKEEEESQNLDIPEEQNINRIESHKISTETEEFEVVTPVSKTSDTDRTHHQEQVKGHQKEHVKPGISNDNIEKQKEPVSSNDDYLNFDELNRPKKDSGTETLRRKSYDEIRRENQKRRKTKSGGKTIFIFIIIFLLAAIAVLYLYYNNKVETYKKDIAKLNNRVVNLTADVNSRNELYSLINSNNTEIINLQGLKNNGDDYANLILNIDKHKGIIQFSGLPQISKNDSYQLWVYSSRKYTTLGVFKSINPTKFYEFSTPDLPQKSGLKFLITKENFSGSKKPGKDLIATGSLK